MPAFSRYSRLTQKQREESAALWAAVPWAERLVINCVMLTPVAFIAFCVIYGFLNDHYHWTQY